jgi:hypothetical protein
MYLCLKIFFTSLPAEILCRQAEVFHNLPRLSGGIFVASQALHRSVIMASVVSEFTFSHHHSATLQQQAGD